MILGFDDETPTSRGTPRSAHLRKVDSLPPEEDQAVLLGKLLAAAAKNEATINTLALNVGTLSREVSQLSRDIADDHTSRLATAKNASKHTSNRMAGLLGALFVIWEFAAPYLQEFLKLVHR